MIITLFAFTYIFHLRVHRNFSRLYENMQKLKEYSLPCAKQLVNTQLDPDFETLNYRLLALCLTNLKVMSTIPAECKGRSLSACCHTSP